MLPTELIKIKNILNEFLGQPKRDDDDNPQLQYNCPCCTEQNDGIPDGKYNLEVNFQIQRFHCWKCGDTDNMKGKISYLIKRYGNSTLYKSYVDEIESIRRTSLYDFNLYSGITMDVVDEVQLKLPKTYKKLNLQTAPKRVVEYCKKRRIDQNIIDKFNIGYTSWDNEESAWRNRLIIPSYNSFGELNYFVGRDYMPPKKHIIKKESEEKTPDLNIFNTYERPKYKNCDADKKEVVFQESKIDTDADIILVEGAIDCIYGPNTISMLGKVLTKDSELYRFLYNKANARIIICLDNDTKIEETKKIYNLLNFGRLKDKIYYIHLNIYKDFGELYEQFGKNGIITALKSAEQFEEIDLMI